MSRRNVLLLGGVAALALLLGFGCSLLLRDAGGVPASDGWYIKLQIKAPAASKGITVTEYQVTGLQIEVRDPEDEVLQTLNWEAEDGSKSYLVPVNQLGQYEIEVTHIGEQSGQTVEATESAVFNIQAMVITVIDIVPGCIGLIKVEPGGQEQPTFSILGYWNWHRAYAKYTSVLQFTPDGVWTSWEDYAGTIEGDAGTWSQSGDTLTFVLDGVPMSGTAQWVNENQLQASMPGMPAPMVLYRRGFEPDGYLFNNPKYPPITLIMGTPAQGNLAMDGSILYRYVAGANAQNSVIAWQDRINSVDFTADLNIWVYEDEGTLAYPGRATESPINVALTPGQTYDIVVANQPGNLGSFSILVGQGDYIGIWFGSNLATPGWPVDAKITCNNDGTYESLLYDVGGSTLQSMSQHGTYACSNNILTATTTDVYNGATWVPQVLISSSAYSVSGNTMTLYQDFDQDLVIDAIWTLIKQ